MKVTAATLSFSVLLFANPFVLVQSRERALKDDEIAGEATIKDGDCKMECEWNARLDKEDGVELFDVECKVSIGDDEFEKDIEFPTGWVQATFKADGSDDSYEFSTTFTIEDDLLITVAEGEISYTIDVVEDEYGDDKLSYSSQSIGVTCV